jgi:hypothetical protein
MSETPADDFAFTRRQLALEDGRYLVLYDFPSQPDPEVEQAEAHQDEEGNAE